MSWSTGTHQLCFMSEELFHSLSSLTSSLFQALPFLSWLPHLLRQQLTHTQECCWAQANGQAKQPLALLDSRAGLSAPGWGISGALGADPEEGRVWRGRVHLPRLLFSAGKVIHGNKSPS